MTATVAPASLLTITVSSSTTPVALGNVAAGSLIINNDSNNVVYLAGSTSVSSVNGIRLGPLGSLSWVLDSPVYAIGDVANLKPGNIQVSNLADNPINPIDVAVATAIQLNTRGLASDIGTATAAQLTAQGIPRAIAAANASAVGLTPTAAQIGTATAAQVSSQGVPNEIAVATAAQLVPQGIPSKLLVTAIGTYTIPPGGGFTVPVDLTAYASLYLDGVAQGNIPPYRALSYAFTIMNTFGKVFRVGQGDTLAADAIGHYPGYIIPVTGPQLLIYNYSTYPIVVTLIGYNRTFSTHVLGNGAQSSGCYISAVNAIPTTPGNKVLDSYLTDGQYSQGQCHVYANNILPIGTPPAQWALSLSILGTNINYNIMTQGDTISNGNQQIGSVLRSLPASPYQLTFASLSTLTSTGTARLVIIPATTT